MEKKKYKSWRKSVEKDGVSKSVSVREVENGFVIDLEEYGDHEGEWKSKCKTYISTKNPLEGEKEYDEEIDLKESILKDIDNMLDF